ncbi:MAG: YveK family protein, partial [Anaerolineales bacterium]
ILRRRGWIMILLALLTAASAYVFSRVQTPVYRSTIFVGVQPARPDFGLTESAKKLLRYYVTVINTNTYAQKVINDPAVQLDSAPEALLNQVTIASDDSRFVIQIDVKNQNGDLANTIAQKWADALVQWRNTENAKIRREDQVDAVVLDPPQYALYSPRTNVNTLAGGILGLLLGGVVIFILEYLESNVIRSPQDVERTLKLSVLGAIPELAASRRKG